MDALSKLRSRCYDLLVLDLVLPIRNGEPPDIQGGKRVLAEITQGSECLKPSHIICLTEFPDAAPALKDAVDRSLAHVVIYDPKTEAWELSLEAKAKYVKDRLLGEANVAAKDYKIDLLIITSSSQHELKQVTALPSEFFAEFNHCDAMYYYHSEWRRPTKRSLSVVACAAPAMGMTAACVTACKAIDRFRPRFVAMTGIAAGTSKDQTYGDILVGETAYDYGSGKILETSTGEKTFIPSPKQLSIEPALHAILQRWEREQKMTKEISDAWHVRPIALPKIFLGLIASGAAVVQSKAFVNEILSDSRKVVGIDMEAYAIFQAAYLAKDPKPRVLIAKSVSDFADRDKKDDWQAYAAFTSARFVYEFFVASHELFAD